MPSRYNRRSPAGTMGRSTSAAAIAAEAAAARAVDRHRGDGGGGGGQAAADVAGGSWESSPFRKGGRVRYSEGGIVSLKNAKR